MPFANEAYAKRYWRARRAAQARLIASHEAEYHKYLTEALRDAEHGVYNEPAERGAYLKAATQ